MDNKKKIDTESELKLIKALSLDSFIKATFLGRESETILNIDQQAGLANILGDVEMLVNDVIN